MGRPIPIPLSLRGLVPADGYDVPDAKKQFLADGAAYLRKLAKYLELPKGTYFVSTNPGGVAVSGESSMRTDWCWMQIHRDYETGGASLLYRAASPTDRYGANTGQNLYVRVSLLAYQEYFDDFIAALERLRTRQEGYGRVS